MTLRIRSFYVTLSITVLYYNAECHYAECRYADCRYAECRYAECRIALRRSYRYSGVPIIAEILNLHMEWSV
jgi:hypothetical protein